MSNSSSAFKLYQDETPVTLKYHAHLKWAATYLSVMGYLLIAIAALSSALLFFGSGHFLDSLTNLFIIIFSGFFFLSFAREIKKQFVDFKLKVFSDRFEVHRSSKIEVVPYEKVSSIDFRYIPFLGGWFFITLRNGDRHKFTLVLEKSFYFVETLIKFNPDLSGKKSEGFIRTAIISDMGLSRLNASFKDYSRWLLKYFALPLILGFAVAFFRHKSPLVLMTAFVLASVLFGACFNFIAEIYLKVRSFYKLKSNPFNRSREIELENKLRFRFDIAYIALVGLYFFLHLIK
jgi:hypothetical protein